MVGGGGGAHHKSFYINKNPHKSMWVVERNKIIYFEDTILFLILVSIAQLMLAWKMGATIHDL